jgi:predicted nicotinamide N-methyase
LKNESKQRESHLAQQLTHQLQQTLPRAGLVPTCLPDCPQISLYLFDPVKLQGPLTHEEAQAVTGYPAYWSFCWASGQVLATYLLRNPLLVHDKVVLDFGCGSGVVAIAAQKAGARKVFACDIDADARLATHTNARLNGVEIALLADWTMLAEHVDLIVAADVLYDRENLVFLDEFLVKADSVILGDSRVKNLPHERYALKQTEFCRTCPDLNEFEEFNTVNIYETF